MAVIIHSKHAAGLIATARPQTAGAVHVAKFRHSFALALAAGAILELGVLPNYCDIVDYSLVPQGNFAGVTFSAGLMSGELGADDDARVVGNELFAAGSALTQYLAGTKPEAFDITSTPLSRGIGLQFSGQVAADPAKKLLLILRYRS